MALKELKTENFLGKTQTHQFYQKNKVVGANGTGKTTIKEAICFLFTGTDSAGCRNPQHLISTGNEEGCKVTILTDKAEISRTLSRKGNGSIKINKNGVSQTYTQTELEATIGSVDLFLSAFIPGYFLELSTEKQHKIISDLMPKIDRIELIKQLSKLDVTSEEKIRYNFSRRADLVSNAIAQDRRELDRQIAMKEGEIKQLETLQPLPEPQFPTECHAIPMLVNLNKEWEVYESDLRSYNQTAARYERIKMENDLRESKRAQLKSRLESIVLHKVPALLNFSSDISARETEKRPLPEKPAIALVVEADNCPTCGQTVGKAQRDRVRERNQQLVSEYESLLRDVRAQNSGLDAAIAGYRNAADTSQRAVDKAVTENRKLEKQLKEIEIELAGLVDQELPLIANEKPKPPESVVEAGGLEKLNSARNRYESDLSKYKYVLEQVETAKESVSAIRTNIVALSSSHARLEILETAVKQIPQEELKRQMDAFKMETVTISVEEEIVVKLEGIRYEYLSTGQRLKADVEICRKLNSLMPRPINMIFLDNADLVDQFSWGESQMFAAFVNEEKTIRIEEVQ